MSSVPEWCRMQIRLGSGEREEGAFQDQQDQGGAFHSLVLWAFVASPLILRDSVGVASN